MLDRYFRNYIKHNSQKMNSNFIQKFKKFLFMIIKKRVKSDSLRNSLEKVNIKATYIISLGLKQVPEFEKNP